MIFFVKIKKSLILKNKFHSSIFTLFYAENKLNILNGFALFLINFYLI